MHFKWNYEAPTPEQEKAAKELGEKLSISPILGQLLIQRGITTESAAKRFFRPQLADLINPFLMKDMDIAVDRLNDAMGRKERILVYGDYDVDGCTAVALVYKFLQQFYSNIDYYIPDRYDEGYGVSKKGIDFANETGVKLIIILDCGIKAIKEIEYAKSLGIDFIICDHHVPDEVMYNIKPNFFITAQGSYNTSRGTSDVFRSPDSHDFKNVTNISQKGKYTLGNTGSDQWAAKLVGNYIHNFDNDGTMLTLNLGGEIKRSKSTSSTLVATGFLSDEQNDIAYATTYPDGGKPSGSEDLSASLGGFLAANFMWKNRYVLDGSYRVSGSSKFGSDHRYAPFWSVGAGWNIHNEEFAKKLGWINTLRLRGSYGYTGSVKFSSYQAVTTYKYNSDYLSYTGVGAIPMGMANPDLKWQTTKKLNVGITSSLFGDRLNVNFDVYNEKTTDMLIDRSLPPSSGTTSVKANLGSQTSNGIEFSLWGKIIKTRDWEWSLSVNGLHSKTTINNISDAMKRMNEQNASGFTSSDGSTNIASSSPLFQYREGESPSAIYAVRSAGIDPATGNEIFIKKDGSYTYKYDSKDQVSCGDTNPTLQGSISSMLQYKNFSLTASFSYRFGGEMYNSTRALKVENVNPRKNCDVRAFTDRWTNVGDVKPYIDIAKATGNTSVYTDRFVEKDDELWLSSLYLQYNVPMTFLKKLHIQKMYLGIGTEDLFRITSAKYERGTSYPFSRSINMSASLTF